MRKRRNPNELTIDEIKTAVLIETEGGFYCWRTRKYVYPAITINMCNRDVLEPARRVMKRTIMKSRDKKVICSPELFPPDGRGRWEIEIKGKPAERLIERLKPHLTTYTLKRWRETVQKCKPPMPLRPYRRKNIF